MRLYTATIMMNSIMKTMGRSQHQRETARVNIAMNYKSVQWILFLVSLGKIIIVYQIFLWVDLDTIPFPMCSINVKISDKMVKIFQCLLCFACFCDYWPFIFHFSFPLGWFFSSISQTLRFLKMVSTWKGKQSKIHYKLKLKLHFIKRFWLSQRN